jgi:pimeloyl-ACP methyl ester carboxylesterase
MSIKRLFALATRVFAAMSTTNVHSASVAYRTVIIDGVNIAYREAGTSDKQTILLLHGVPSSSRMYDRLMTKLGDRYHLIAPDYPGFGNSDAPSVIDFEYTFYHLSEMMQKFTDAVGIGRYILCMQDYGAPVGMRLAISRPHAVQGMIFQNGNIYEDGLGPIWESRRAFWADRAAHEGEVREGHLSLAVTRARHIGSDTDIEAYDPDLWMDEYAYLNRPGQADIQANLIYDYKSNIASYPEWQRWLSERRLPTLVIWGKHDLAFKVEGAYAFKRDLPSAKVAVLDAGHFAMDTRLDDVAKLTGDYLEANRVGFNELTK